MTEKKDKKYVSDNAQLMAEWDWEKNEDVLPEQVTLGSHRLVFWIGLCGHRWKAQIKSRSNGRGCPVCAGKVILTGFNDLQTTNPELMVEWDYEKNAPLVPTSIMRGSHERIWWKCKNGHSWQASPNHRTSKGRGCPYCCHNPIVLFGENDLETIYPQIAAEWHPVKNGDLFPNQITANSSKQVWWQCIRGHEWKTAVNHRANGSGCPYCRNAMQTSFPEQSIYYYVKMAYPDAVNGYTVMFNDHGMELDVFIPSLNVGIEYDGVAFHRTETQKQREVKKYGICKEHGTLLIRVRENLNEDTSDICDKAILATSNLTIAITELKSYLPKLMDIDVVRDEQLIRSNYHSELKEKTLLQLFPDLCAEWNCSKNEGLMPEMFLGHSNAKVWWKCTRGHEWLATIDGRVRGNGCPYCSNRRILPGYNDLASKRPDLMSEWNYSKNTLLPDDVLPGSGKKAWWICSTCKHEWFAEISSRNKGAGCPQCARNKSKVNRRLPNMTSGEEI